MCICRNFCQCSAFVLKLTGDLQLFDDVATVHIVRNCVAPCVGVGGDEVPLLPYDACDIYLEAASWHQLHNRKHSHTTTIAMIISIGKVTENR